MDSCRVLLEISISTVNISQFFEKWFQYVIHVTKRSTVQLIYLEGASRLLTARMQPLLPQARPQVERNLLYYTKQPVVMTAL